MDKTRVHPRIARRALVTGATGFVGRHLVRRLIDEGWTVGIIVRSGSELPKDDEFNSVRSHVYDGSFESLQLGMENARPDVVFHVASYFVAEHRSADIAELIQSNLLFGTQLLEAMKNNNVVRLINTGTSWQHYNDEEYNPVCLYAATKQAFEAIVEFYVRACNFRVATLKLFDTYGLADERGKLISKLMSAAQTGEEIHLSPGNQLIDLVHIDDVVDAYIASGEQVLQQLPSIHEIYAVASGKPISLQQLVGLIVEITSRPMNARWGARPYRTREVMVPWGSGVSLPGWKAKVSLSDGLRQIYSAARNS